MSFDHFHFAERGWLWLAVLGPLLLLALQRYSARARERQLARVASPHFVGELTRSHSPARRLVKRSPFGAKPPRRNLRDEETATSAKLGD